MSRLAIDGQTLTDIADAIRAKGQTEAPLTPAEMPEAISKISAATYVQGDKPLIEADEVPWVRPADWPVLDDLPFPEGETTIYLTIDNTNPEAVNVVRFYKQGSGVGYVDYGHVENGQYIVDSTDSGSGTFTFPNHIFTAADPVYPVVRLRGSATLFRENASSGLTAAQSPNGRAISAVNTDMFNVLEVVGSVPTLTSFAASNNSPAYGGRFCRRIVLNNCDRVTNMAYVFMNNVLCDEIKINSAGRITLTGGNISLFNTCYNLRELDLSNVDVSNVTNLVGAFAYCRSLRRLNIDGWNVTNNCSNISSMFRDCYFLEEFGGVSGWDVSNVTALDNMFNNCHRLKAIDISGWHLGKCTTLAYTFSNCYILEDVKMPQYPAPLVTTIAGLFQNDTNLQRADLAAMELRALVTTYSAFGGCSHLEYVNLGRAKVVTASTSTSNGVGSTFANCYSLKQIEWDMSDCDLSVSGTISMYNNCYSLESPLDWSFFRKSSNATTFQLGTNCYKVPSVIFADDIYLPMLTNMSLAFNGWNSIKKIDISGIHTDSKVTTFASTFTNCWNVEEIIMPQLDVSEVTTTANMFQLCNKLKDIPEAVKSWYMPKCTTIGAMLSDCYCLQELDLSNFKCAPTTMSSMIAYLWSLRRADLSGIDTSKVTASQTAVSTYYAIEYLNQTGWIAKHNSIIPQDASSLVDWYPPEPQVAFNMSKLYSLSDESLERLVQVLPKRTSATTITLGNPLIKRLTTQQIATIVQKGWTIA